MLNKMFVSNVLKDVVFVMLIMNVHHVWMDIFNKVMFVRSVVLMDNI